MPDAKSVPPHSRLVYVDFENVPSVELGWIAGQPVHVTLVVGERQRRLELPLVRQIHQLASQVTLVEAGASGRNALDMVLAAHLGHATMQYPEAEFTIISQDKDFDPLITHLRARGVRVTREPELLPPAANPASRAARGRRVSPRPASSASPAQTRPGAPAPTTGPTPSRPLPTHRTAPQRPTTTPRPATDRPAASPDRFAKLLERLTASEGPRPKREDKLRHYIDTCLGRESSEAEVNQAVKDLSQRGVIAITPDGKVTYPDSGDSSSSLAGAVPIRTRAAPEYIAPRPARISRVDRPVTPRRPSP